MKQGIRVTMLASRTRKVPEITGFFWTLKILSTAMGEALSDFLVNAISPVVAVSLGAIGLVIALFIQLSAKTYKPWKYWLTVSMVAIFGTMAADVLHVGLGVPYIASTLLFGILLVCVFSAWYKKEKTLSIHSITSVRRESFYWLTVITTFALGTATGDLSATTFGLGYLASGILFTILILVPLFIYIRFRMKEVIVFWIAYILTRPLGASFADWFGKPVSSGGIGFGSGAIGIVLVLLMIILVVYVSLNKRERTSESFSLK
jgi:uncharacterized membrane-anchored protein